MENTVETNVIPIERAHAEPARQAYHILHWGFVAAPTIAGIDKFTHLLTNWEQYLAGIIVNLLLVSGFYDIAPRDFGLMLAAIALARLSVTYDRGLFGRTNGA